MTEMLQEPITNSPFQDTDSMSFTYEAPVRSKAPIIPVNPEDRTPEQDRQLAVNAKIIEQAYNEHGSFLLGYFSRITGNQDTGAELLQATMEKGVRTAHQYEDRGDGIKPWLVNMGQRILISEERRKKRFREHMGSQVLGDQEEVIVTAGNQNNIARDALKELCWESVVRALADQVNSEHFDAAWHCTVMGVSYEAYARENELSLGTVRSRVSRGRQALAQAVLSNPEFMDLLGTSSADINNMTPKRGANK